MTDVQAHESAAYRWALKASAIALAAIAAMGAGIGAVVIGADAVWAALAGAAVAGVAALVTQVAMIVGHSKQPHVFASIVGGSWLAKMVVIVAGIALLSRVDGLHRGTFGIVAMVCVGATLVVDLQAVRRARISYTGTGLGNGGS